MLISDHCWALKCQTGLCLKGCQWKESGPARSYLPRELQTRYSRPQKSVEEVEWPSKNNHLTKQKVIYILFFMSFLKKSIFYSSPCECVLARITKTWQLPQGVPCDSTTTVASSASNGCNQHSLLSVGFHFYQLTDQWMQTADQPAKDHLLGQPRTTHSDGQSGFSGKKSDTFAKEMPCPSSASQNGVRQVYGCAIVPPKKFRTRHPAPSWANLSAN